MSPMGSVAVRPLVRFVLFGAALVFAAACGGDATISAGGSPVETTLADYSSNDEVMTTTTFGEVIDTTTTQPSGETTTTRMVIGAPGQTTILSCEAGTGSPTDISAEPAQWRDFGEYKRWHVGEGCPVRIDVVSHIRGAQHCDWQAAEFITIGRPFGSPVGEPISEENSVRYIWDPDGVLPGGPYGEVIDQAAIPIDAYDTGFRLDGASLYVDETGVVGLYRVAGGAAEVWHADPTLGLCQ